MLPAVGLGFVLGFGVGFGGIVLPDDGLGGGFGFGFGLVPLAPVLAGVGIGIGIGPLPTPTLPLLAFPLKLVVDELVCNPGVLGVHPDDIPGVEGGGPLCV